MKIKILSYNIHKGFDWRNWNYSLLEMKEFIKSVDVDIVFLQEVVGKNKKFEKQGLVDSQFEFLADQIWPHYSYAHNAVYDHGHHGNLILSKFPIESFENINLSTNSWEQRGLLVCKIKLPSNGLNNDFLYAACSHLNLLHSGRRIQYQKIKEHILLKNSIDVDSHVPFIIAGDFNDWNKKSVHVFEEELEMLEVHKSFHGFYAKTFPSALPLLCLDRIYVKNFLVKDVKILEPRNSNSILAHLSDHLPLYCEVEVYGT